MVKDKEEVAFAQGAERSYLVTTPEIGLAKKRALNSTDYLYLSLLLLISFFTRLTRLNSPPSVVFDEVHFGGFAKKYILGTFFMDVHPPLAKMLFALVSYFAGFKGDFDFKDIADVYPDSTPYVIMRQFPAVLGLASVYFLYSTLKLSGVRSSLAFFTSFILLIENANVTISRYILLDSPLLFFISAAIYSFKKFEIQIPFSIGYYKSLVVTGIALGLALSSKWVGLFTVSWVGFLCVYQIWFIIGDLLVSKKLVAKHFFSRGVILVGIPLVLYYIFFIIHFILLSKEGDGSAFMTSPFRSTLQGNTIPKNIVSQVGLGSKITIKHANTNGGYLHSHSHFYPAGSKQQQITLYPHLDSNNNWIIEHYDNTTYPTDKYIPLTNNMKIRLRHQISGRRLHSHDEKAPVSERDWQKEASCYGFDGFPGDANDDFVVEIVHKALKKLYPGQIDESIAYVDGDGVPLNETEKAIAVKADLDKKEQVRAIDTIFRLRHAMSGHYLFSSNVKLPDWGFKQQEVTTAGQGKRELTYWYIETNENELLPHGTEEIVNYITPSYWDKFVESHKRMWAINSGLTEHHHWQSNPQDWPFLLRGINYWVKDHKQVYLMGNAVTWWAVTISIITFGIHFIISVFKWNAGKSIASNKDVFNFNYQTFSYVLGWALHYFPFFIMGRQLFIHHYIPALYFGILALGHFFELFIAYILGGSKHLQKIGFIILTAFLALSSVFYYQYSPLIYGTQWTKSQCLSAKYLQGWDFDCNAFYDEISQYSETPTESVLPPQQSDLDAVPVVNADEAKETPKAQIEDKIVEEIHQSPIVDIQEENADTEQLVPQFEEDSTVKAQEDSHPEIVQQVEPEIESPKADTAEQDSPEIVQVVQEAVEEVYA